MNKPYLWLKDNISADHLPDVSHALTEPDGLLAIGGEINPEQLLVAYRKGIFKTVSPVIFLRINITIDLSLLVSGKSPIRALPPLPTEIR